MATVQEYTTPDGKQGTIVRDSNGHFLPGTRTHAPITHENARDMHARRRELAQAAARDAMLDVVQRNKLPAVSDVDAWGQVIAHTTDTLLGSDTLRGMPETIRVLGQATGYLNNERDSDTSSGGVVNNTLILAGDVAADLLSRLNAFDNSNYSKPIDAIDGSSTDSSEQQGERTADDGQGGA